MLVIRPRPDDEPVPRMPQLVVPGGYAVPREPIRVVLARDEEEQGGVSEAVKARPPAYGLWRESVVCNDIGELNVREARMLTTGTYAAG